MKISVNWLKEFVEVDLSAAELADALTMTGLEVEGVAALAHGIDGVVIAEIVGIKPHPNKDELTLCQVSDGAREYQVVCGAKNMKTGDKGVLARHGATLAGGMKIKRGKFRGVMSEGMLCSEAELGLAEEAEEIIILEPDAPVGEDPLSFYQLCDEVLDITVTPNRPDCLSVLGVAREVAAITGKRLIRRECPLTEADPPAQELIQVKVLDPDLCPRYSARVMTDVKLGPSHLNVKTRLYAAGIRPINNLVDATNYVMMERGQPLHAFDLDLLVGREIVVRRAGADMEFVTLDGQPRRLTAEMLAICDGEMPVALGGVMGGHNSEVGAVTRNILLEAAHFDPVSIRRTSKSLKLSTEASIRFERGVDPEATIPALDRAAGMIQRAGGGNIQAGVVDCRESRLKQEKLSLRVSRASRLLGLDMSAAEVEKVLAGLGLPTEVGDDRVEVSVPSYRFDLKEEIDLVEEVARLIGYHKVPLAKLRLHGLPAGEKLLEQVFHKCRELLTSQGYLETINYSFIPPAQAAPFLEQGSQLVEISNPLSQEQSVMRPSLIPGLLESARRNVNRDLTDIRFFELGKVFWLSPGETGPQEGWRIVALGTGQRADRFWSQKQGKPHMFDFHDIKGAAENLLEGMGITGCRVRPADTYYLHEGVRAELLVGDKPVGVLGRVHPDILGSLGGLLLALSDMYLFELDLEEVAGSVPEKVTFAPLAKYPFLARDLAVVVKEEVVAEEVRDAIISLNADIIAEVSLFDLYRGEQVGPGKKSLAFSIKFQATDRTLTDKEVDATIDRAVATLADRFAASLRGGKEKER